MRAYIKIIASVACLLHVAGTLSAAPVHSHYYTNQKNNQIRKRANVPLLARPFVALGKQVKKTVAWLGRSVERACAEEVEQLTAEDVAGLAVVAGLSAAVLYPLWRLLPPIDLHNAHDTQSSTPDSTRDTPPGPNPDTHRDRTRGTRPREHTDTSTVPSRSDSPARDTQPRRTPVYDGSIEIGGQRCYGYEQQLPNHVVFKQVDVLCQRESGFLGGYASCGYHVAKNGAAIAQAFAGTLSNLNEQLNSPEVAINFFGIRPHFRQGTWRTQALAQRSQEITAGKRNDFSCDKKGDWLVNNLVERFLQQELSGLEPQGVDTDVRSLAYPSFFAEPHRNAWVPAIKQQLVLLHRYTKVFVLVDEEAAENGRGHFIVVVLHKKADGTREYIAANSANNNPLLTNNMVRALVRVIEGDAVSRQLVHRPR